MKIVLSTAYVKQVSLTIATGVAGVAWLALAWLSMALAQYGTGSMLGHTLCSNQFGCLNTSVLFKLSRTSCL